jgi:hypothetical protein
MRLVRDVPCTRIVRRPLLEWLRSGRKGTRSIQPDYDWTIDGEAGASEWGAARACQQAI